MKITGNNHRRYAIVKPMSDSPQSSYYGAYKVGYRFTVDYWINERGGWKPAGNNMAMTEAEAITKANNFVA